MRNERGEMRKERGERRKCERCGVVGVGVGWNGWKIYVVVVLNKISVEMN
jgi:hypothetical protein